MWLSSRVGAAEAALATLFVGGAALAASPGRPRRPDPQHTDDEALPPLEEADHLPSIDISLAEAWAAVRRAASAAIMVFEDPTVVCEEVKPDPKKIDTPDTTDQTKRGRPPAIDEHEFCEECDCRAVAHDASHQIEYSDVTASSSMGELASWRDTNIPCCQDDSHYVTTPQSSADDPQTHLNPKREARKSVEATSFNSENDHRNSKNVLKVTTEGNTDEFYKDAHEENVTDPSVLSELRLQFDITFEQNGGADCVARVKQIGDDALVGMQDSTRLDNRVIAELEDAKLVLDDALRRLDAAVRESITQKNPEYSEAVAAADAVIDETKENALSTNEGTTGLIADGSRLLAVFATKVCANVLRRVEEGKGSATWSERVERIADIAIVGITQLRAVSQTFAFAILRSREVLQDEKRETVLKKQWPVEIRKLSEAAVGYVMQCVALAIAALQIEAAERAHLCSAQS